MNLKKDTLFIGADHRGVRLKKHLCTFLEKKGFTVYDVGTHTKKIVDYPDIAKKVAKNVSKNKGNGILVCSTGVGMEMAANKHVGVRAANAWNSRVARLSRREDDANILCIPNDFVTRKEAERIVSTWLATPFSMVERYRRRRSKLARLET